MYVPLLDFTIREHYPCSKQWTSGCRHVWISMSSFNIPLVILHAALEIFTTNPKKVPPHARTLGARLYDETNNINHNVCNSARCTPRVVGLHTVEKALDGIIPPNRPSGAASIWDAANVIGSASSNPPKSVSILIRNLMKFLLLPLNY